MHVCWLYFIINSLNSNLFWIILIFKDYDASLQSEDIKSPEQLLSY